MIKNESKGFTMKRAHLVLAFVLSSLFVVSMTFAHVKQEGMFPVMTAYAMITAKSASVPAPVVSTPGLAPSPVSGNNVVAFEQRASGQNSNVQVVNGSKAFGKMVADCSCKAPVIVKVYTAVSTQSLAVKDSFQKVADQFSPRCTFAAMDMALTENQQIIIKLINRLNIGQVDLPLFFFFANRRPIAVMQGVCPPDLIARLCDQVKLAQ